MHQKVDSISSLTCIMDCAMKWMKLNWEKGKIKKKTTLTRQRKGFSIERMEHIMPATEVTKDTIAKVSLVIFETKGQAAFFSVSFDTSTFILL